MRNNVQRNSTKSSEWGEPEKCGSTEIQIWPKLSVKWGQGGGGGAEEAVWAADCSRWEWWQQPGLVWEPLQLPVVTSSKRQTCCLVQEEVRTAVEKEDGGNEAAGSKRTWTWTELWKPETHRVWQRGVTSPTPGGWLTAVEEAGCQQAEWRAKCLPVEAGWGGVASKAFNLLGIKEKIKENRPLKQMRKLQDGSRENQERRVSTR